MTRKTLLAAIRVGIKRGGSPDLIADAIETALEIEASSGSDEVAEPVASRPAPTETLPVAEGVIEPVTDLRAVPNPVNAPPPSMVIVVGEDDMKREIENRAQQPLRMRSLDQSATRKSYTIEEGIRFWEENSPLTIKVHPEGREEPVVLERNIRAMPGMATRGMKPVHMVKICYKHPAVEDAMEVSFASATNDIGPDLKIKDVMEKIHADAMVMYRPRVAKIAPHRPPSIGWGDFAGGVNEGTPAEQDAIQAAVNSGNKDQLRERILKS